MTTNDIKKIINGLNKPNNTNVFYDMNEITRRIDAYVVNNWIENENKYSGKKLIAILAPQNFLADEAVYFLDEGVVISEKYIAYEEIVVVGKCDFFHAQKLKDNTIICYGKENMVVFSKKKNTRQFACEIIEEIIDLKKSFHDNNEKIRYYLHECNRFEDEPFAFIIYKKILQLTQEPHLIGDLVKKYGFSEFVLKYQESTKKRQVEELKPSPKDIVSIMTVVMIKNVQKSITERYCKMYENVFLDCLPYLKLMQNCNILNGYKSFVYIFYIIGAYAAEIQQTISAELVYCFNSTINELRNKIEKNIITIPQEDNFEVLAMIKSISDIYCGKICCDSQSTQKEYKYTFLKNLDSAYYWLNLYINQIGSENTVEYEDVMFNLADIYRYGTSNINADENKRLECLKTAANHGCTRASKYLAEYYINENSKEKDKWIQLAKENGQKVKDKRSINEKMKESVGINLFEVAEALEGATEIGRNVSETVRSLRTTVETFEGITIDCINAKADKKEAENRLKETTRNAERGKLEHEQYMEGQKVENKRAKVKSMKYERKADKAIAKEEKKSR